MTYHRSMKSVAAALLLAAMPLTSAAFTSTANATDNLMFLARVAQLQVQVATEVVSNKSAGKKSAKNNNNRQIKAQSDLMDKDSKTKDAITRNIKG